MFRATQSSVLLDHLRIPYRVGSPSDDAVPLLERLPGSFVVTAEPPSRPAFVCFAAGGDAVGSTVARPAWLKGIPVFGRVATAEGLERRLAGLATNWTPATRLVDASGEVTSTIWRDTAGNLVVPFDLDTALINLWSEAYTLIGKRASSVELRRLAMSSYYHVRPVLPRSVQIWLRRRLARIQARRTFPRWPVEPAVHELGGWLLGLLSELVDEPVPSIAPWPDGRSWALVLTHDVETSFGYDRVGVVTEVETGLGYRSSWNFVPERDYTVHPGLVADLIERGFEVGVHGLYHDGRDLESVRTLSERLPAIHRYARAWRATGFRSPSTQRSWELMHLLEFDYDSSYPDTGPFEPQGGGCCSWLPFFNDHLVELPITLAQDHTLFVMLGETDEAAWVHKASILRGSQGMALLDTHPDYLVEESRLDSYRRFLEHWHDDLTVWRALPRDVSAWWRRRAASSLERDGAGWTVVGPAEGEARVAGGPAQ